MRSSVMVVSVTGFLLVATAVTGCSRDEGDGPTPPTTPSSEGGQASVPKVTNPLSTGSFLGNPCQLVDDSIFAQIGEFGPGKPDVDSDAAKNLIGPSCTWESADYSRAIDVVISTVHQKQAEQGFKGLDGVYASHEDGKYLEPVVVQGYPGNPAAFAGENAKRDRGECSLYVGIADDLVFRVGILDENNPANACPAAPRVAGAVLDSLTKGA